MQTMQVYVVLPIIVNQWYFEVTKWYFFAMHRHISPEKQLRLIYNLVLAFKNLGQRKNKCVVKCI